VGEGRRPIRPSFADSRIKWVNFQFPLTTLTYHRFPPNHWVRIRTNNPMERIIREIRRRTRVVGAFPDGQSAVMLCATRLRHIAGTKWGTRRYLNMDTLKQQNSSSSRPPPEYRQIKSAR